MNSKRFLKVNIPKGGFTLININNIALIEEKNRMAFITLNVRNLGDKQVIIETKENFGKIVDEATQMDNALNQ
jgi:hypothetical protein